MKVFRSVLYVLVWLAALAAEVYAALRLWKLSVLPLKHKLILCMVLFTAWVIAGVLFFFGNSAQKGRHPGLLRRIVAWALAVLLSCGSVYSTRVADHLDATIETVTRERRQVSMLAVYVLEDDPAYGLEDAADYTFGATTRFDADNVRSALSELRELLGSVKTEEYDTMVDMVRALYDGSVGAMILNEAYVKILEDLDDYGTFSEDTRVLYEIEVEEGSAAVVPIGTPKPVSGEPDNPDDPEQTAEPDVEIGEYDAEIENFVPVNVTKEPFIVYLSGSDTRSRTLTTSLSDVNILVVVNPNTRQILLVNTPRDYYVANPAGGGAMDKLTHCGIYGIGCSVGALSNLYHMPVNYYAQINFTGFETLINAIGGITVHSDYAFTMSHGQYPVVQGENHFNGIEAVGYVRERYSFSTGDRQRGKNQMAVLTAVIEKMSKGTIILHHTEILNSLQGMFVTNLSADEISSLVKLQLSDGTDWSIRTFAVKGYDSGGYTYSMPGYVAYYMEENSASIRQAAKLMQRVLSGEKLTKSDVADSD